jgi:hypothetical protein
MPTGWRPKMAAPRERDAFGGLGGVAGASVDVCVVVLIRAPLLSPGRPAR